MPLTRLDNLISSKTGKYLYVSPDDFNATDALSNRGNSPVTPFKSIQRAFLEVARYSYTPGPSNDRFDQFSIMLMPGIHYIDNRPGLVDTTGITEFDFDELSNSWGDDPILDVGDPDNILYLFNNTEGGAIIPRGSSLVGYDLRRTTIRPLYVPDPASVTVPRSAIFNVTGGCYFWQFTIKDGQTTAESPLYNPAIGSGEVYYDPTNFTKKAVPNFSHHKLTVFEYADKEELQLFYRKIAKAFSKYQTTIDDPGEFDYSVQENRIVGPLSDSRVIESLKFSNIVGTSSCEIEVTTKVDHGYFAGQFVAIANTEIDEEIEGFWPIYDISDDPRKFTYRVPFVVSGIGQGLTNLSVVSVDSSPVALGQNAQVLAEVDSVESASPYVFNVSIRSVWGVCGIWANGLKATGFKSMVIAQYTGVSLQRDDRAFIRYDEYANTWNQASLIDAFATVPYHAKGDSYWKDDWRNFHVRASDDAFIQNVSIFAVGFADHFLMESGGDMSITNSNSNFGNTSLHAIGFKGFSFNQDKAGYITDIIPPQRVVESETNREKILYYTIDVQGTKQNPLNRTKLFLGGTDLDNPLNRPAATIDGYRIGAKSNDKLYFKDGQVYETTIEPTGFVKYLAKGSVLNPTNFTDDGLIDNLNIDAANLIESNRRMIQEEVFGYILEKYPRLQNISYVNPGLNPAAGRYFDARNLIINNRQEIVDTAYDEMLIAFPNYDGNNGNTFGVKCKRDIGYIVDAIAEDLRDGGNANIIEATKFYFDGVGDPLANGLVGEEDPAVFAFNRAKDLCKKAIANLLTVKATIYDPESPSILSPYGVVAGSTGSDALGLDSEGVTVDDANKQDPAGRYKDARNLIVANREFILDAALAEVSVYHPDFYIPGDSQTDALSRFADAFRMIRRNSKEIQDRALAAIAVAHPDFYFPGDAQTTDDSRFYDSYRLIQQNKTEIVNTAWTNMVTLYPGVAPTETKCKRDIGYFVDAVSLDLFIRGNEYSYRFAAEYFENATTPISNGLVGQETQSITAFDKARDLMKQAITNQLTVKDLTITADPNYAPDNQNPASCADVQTSIDTLTGIVTTIIDDGDLSSLPIEINKGSSPAGMTKCGRDVGYFIDAIGVDLHNGSNIHTKTFIQQYFDGNTPISNGLVDETTESNTAFNAARDYMKQAVTNQLYYKDLTVTADGVSNTDPAACADVQSAIDVLTGYVTTAVTNGNLNSLPADDVSDVATFAGRTKCRRDLGYVVDAVAQDLWFGGNEYTIAATKEYFNQGSLIANGVDNEVGPSITAFKRAADLMNRVVNNQYYVRDLTVTLDQVGDPALVADIHSDAYNLVLDNKEFIAKEAYERMKDGVSSVQYSWNPGGTVGWTPRPGTTEQDCLDDVYDVLAQVMYDVKFGGNAKTYDAANVYVTNEFTPEGFILDYPANPVVGRTTGASDTLGFYTEAGITWAWDGTAWKIETFIDEERDEASAVFGYVKDIAIQVLRNETVSVSTGNTLTQKKDLTIVDDWDAEENLPKCGSAVAAVDSLFDIIIQAIGTDAGVGDLTGVVRTVPVQPTTYTLGNCSDVLATIDTLIGILCDALIEGSLNSLPPLSNGEWDCANVRSSIENLFDILTDAINTGSLANLPIINQGDFIINAEESKCFRDVSYIVDAVVNDLRYGGNINSIQAGEAYFVGAQLDYIDGEAVETTDAWNYVGQMAIAAMRNFDFLAFNCATTNSSTAVTITSADGVGTRTVPSSAIVDVGDTSGILIGMRVTEYQSTPSPYVNGLLQDNAVPNYSNIPEDTYVKSIIDSTRIELGTKGSRLDSGVNQNAQLPPSSTVSLYFTFENGQWANTLPKTVTVGPESSNPDVIQDTTISSSQRECASTALAITQLVNNITTIINVGLTYVDGGGNILPTVDRQEPTFNTALLASRATVFTIDVNGTGSTNAHNFETGTPVRLVPRPRFDTASGKYVDVDKRLIRLPNGFDTNTTYYVISPGRATNPVDYSVTPYFNGSDQTKLMLATSKQNAAAGIYIYASETESIDPDIEIDLYKFVIDEKYDLHTYSCNLFDGIPGGIETDIANIFDKPSTATIPQKVFFRTIEGSELPDLSSTYAEDPTVAIISGTNSGKINPNVEFFVRYQTNKVFTIHKTIEDALSNTFPISFASQNGPFRVFANKKRSPMRFDPTFNGVDTVNGKWFIQTKDSITGQNDQTIVDKEIYTVLNSSNYQGKTLTTDTWFERINDTRSASDRTYKLRYVIPKYIENARDPINGFVIKTRTDDTRKLVPQKLLLKPVAGNVYGARFENKQQSGEFIGFTNSEFESDDTLKLEDTYDPYRRPLTGQSQDTNYKAIARFSSGIAATIQSGRYVKDVFDENIEYLEITVFDHTVDTVNFPGLRNEIFTTVKITAPQGGSFVSNKTEKISTNIVSFSGNSSGSAYIHGYYNVGGDHYLIIKGISGTKGTNSLEYSEFQNTRFTQGAVFADMLEDQDMGKSLPLKTHIRKNFPEYFYKQNGANVYTITPGDRIQDDAGIEYYVYSVKDTGVIEDTFYIFDSQELQKRIPGQQDGIYYLTVLRGNISPYPLGSGVGGNFRKFKFSQPVGKLYPLNYRNDPLWFTKNGTTEQEKNYYSQLIDPPQAFSAADNYIHGKVTVNDTKNSVTKELIIDLLKQPSFVENSYTNENVIEAQLGNASSGSEDRLIPIAGDSTVISDQRYYVELRRPSIARAGNHTFEYLGFGPGNYSTGLPARQEIVLTPDEDFYAQSKKQDAGIVFYTGINSQGDLYIGNRRINAITGEETFIDRAVLVDDGDKDDIIGQLVASFETAVTFNENITIVGGSEGDLVSNFNAPIAITVLDGLAIDGGQLKQQGLPLIVKSFVAETDYYGTPQDNGTLDRNNFPLAANGIDNTGDIRIGKNRVDAAIFGFNSRGGGQNYKIQTHAPGGVASNISPNQDSLISAGGSRINESQLVRYSTLLPDTGDVLLKGESINKNGSLGWVYSNIYTIIERNVISSLQVIVDQSVNIGILTFIDQNGPVAIGPTGIGIKSGSEIRLSNINYNGLLNGTWKVLNTDDYPYDGAGNVVYFQINPRTGNTMSAFNIGWDETPNGTGLVDFATTPPGPSPNAEVSFSTSNWKELGVIGAEALRTETETWGDFKLGINTINRASHDAYTNAFVETQNTDPRANLDVVGNTYISGRKTGDWLDHDEFVDREKNAVRDALVVGGNSGNITDLATLRVSTEGTVSIAENGRNGNAGMLGINATDAELDRALVVVGDSRFTEDARFQRDITVYTDGGDETGEIRTGITTGTFNLLNDSTFVGGNNSNGLNLAGYSKTIRIGDVTTDNQWISIGNSVSDDQIIKIGNSADHSNIFLGDIDDNADYISRIQIGGAYGNNSSNSYVTFGTRRVNFAGDVVFGANKLQGGDRLNPEMTISVGTEAGIVQFFTNNTQTLDFATNASEINIGGQGGQTKVRNNLVVDAGARFNSNVTLCGGFASFSFVGNRAQLGSISFSHSSGILGQNTFNSNIDIINVFVVSVVDQNAPTPAELTAGFNRVDTAGAGVWGGNSGVSNFQAAIPGAGPEGATLPALSGLEYYIPMKYKPTPYFQAGDYIIIDTAISGSGGSATHPEIVRITEDGLQGAETAPYYLKVRRQPLGTFTTIKTNHPDTTNVWKVNVAFDATWITEAIDASGSQDNVYLSEFGGQLTTNDYVIIDREDTNNDGIADQGEVFKVASLLEQVAKKFSIKNGCDTQAEETVFEVNSTNGSVSLGDPGNTNTSTFIYGNLTVTGQCGGAGTADNTKLTFNNELYTTAEIDICTGNAFFGSNYATVFVVGEFYGSTAAAHSTTDTVHVYRRDPFTVQAAGPLTTILATQQTGSVTAATSNIPIATNLAAFAEGDLVAIVDGVSKVEVIQITDDPYTDLNGNLLLPTSTNSTYPSGGRGREGTVAQAWDSGAVVVKIQKDPRTTTLAEPIPATGRTAVEFPNINPNKIRIKMVNGDLVAEKLDYEYIIRIGTEWFYPDSKSGAVDPVYGVRLPKSYRDPVTGDVEKFFGGGDLTTHGSLNITSGNIRVYGTDGTTLVFNVTNDDGHPGDGAIVDPVTGRNGMYLKGFANIFGNLQVYNEQCQENGSCDNKLVFKVDRLTGKVDMGQSLYIQGQVFESESPSTPILHIDNLGSAGVGGTSGPKDFIMYQDGSIDAFGITQYFTANGGRRWTYVSQSATGIGQTQSNPLQPNNNYLLNLTSGGNMVLYLPTNAVTGDIIRFVELTGNLSYNTNLVIRALRIANAAVGIQGDFNGSKLTSGTGSSLLSQAWDSGELIVQTRNAGFGLLYVGSTDAPNDPLASEIPSNLRGWWLVEL